MKWWWKLRFAIRLRCKLGLPMELGMRVAQGWIDVFALEVPAAEAAKLEVEIWQAKG